MRVRSICVIVSAALALAACQATGENRVAALGTFEARLPDVRHGEASAPPCDSLDGAMCARDGTLLCAGALEGVNAPAMCPTTSR